MVVPRSFTVIAHLLLELTNAGWILNFTEKRISEELSSKAYNCVKEVCLRGSSLFPKLHNLS